MEFTSKSENPHFPEVWDLDPKEIHSKTAELTLIDVRRPDEFVGELGHIPGSTLLTLDQLPAKLDTLSKDDTIIFVCRSGARSAQAASFALESGFNDVYNMRGGMLLWNEYGLKTEK
jgi:rhodanese-related sulfurtransferase